MLWTTAVQAAIMTSLSKETDAASLLLATAILAVLLSLLTLPFITVLFGWAGIIICRLWENQSSCSSIESAYTIQQPALRQAILSYIHMTWHIKRRLQSRRSATAPTGQTMLPFLSCKLRERQSPCMICLQDMANSRLLQVQQCGHGYCKFCVATHLQVKLRNNQHDMLRCPFPECTGEFAVLQCQQALLQDIAVSFLSVS